MGVQSCSLLLVFTCTLLGGSAEKLAQPLRFWNSKLCFPLVNSGKVADFLHADSKSEKLSVNLLIIKWVSHKWFDESSWLTELFLNADSYWIIFGLTTNLLSIFEIYLMSTAVVLVKNVLLLVPTGKVLELGSPKCF